MHWASNLGGLELGSVCGGVVDGVLELGGVRSQALWACVDGASDPGKQELGFLGLCGRTH